MQEIWEKIKEIDSTARAVAASVEDEKALVSEEYQKMTRDFDTEMRERTDKKIKETSERLTAEFEAELARMNREAEDEKTSLTREFEESHETMAKNILARLLSSDDESL